MIYAKKAINIGATIKNPITKFKKKKTIYNIYVIFIMYLATN